jgi:hypothetical protein
MNCFPTLLSFFYVRRYFTVSEESIYAGEAVQVEPMKPRLKPPGNKRLETKIC